MLKQRVITALVLLAVFLPTLFLGPALPFQVLSLCLIAAAAWEWARLNGCGPVEAPVWAGGLVLACAVAAMLGGAVPNFSVFWPLVGAAWLLLGGWVLHAGVAAWAGHARWLRLLGGQLVLGLAWLALVQAHAIGRNFLLSVLALVWVADIAAYFVGRTWGGRLWARKLAGTISPGKSWEGALGGMVGAIGLAFLWCGLDALLQASSASLFTRLAQTGWLGLLWGTALLASVSVLGDLLESLVKRSAGVKDSSALLPGHGGVLDRVDALLPSLPLAMALSALATNHHLWQ